MRPRRAVPCPRMQIIGSILICQMDSVRIGLSLQLDPVGLVRRGDCLLTTPADTTIARGSVPNTGRVGVDQQHVS